MSLFGTINNAKGALQVSQIGLQTVGTNIANANTEGYIRQELIQTTPEPYRRGNLIQGHGVRAAGIMQRVDKALLSRMWDASSDLSAAKVRDRTLADVEALLNDLNGGGLSDDLASLNAAIHDLSVEPNDQSLRQFVLLSAESLSREINRSYTNARAYQTELNATLNEKVDRINALADKVADLNLQILTIEGGRTLASDATGLRDERYRTIEELATLVKVNVQEQASGSVSIFIGGDYLVAETYIRPLYVNNEKEVNSGQVLFQDTDAQVQILGGELKSMTDGRDVLLGGVLEGLDQMAQDLIREFNTVHSQGQGARGFQELTGTVMLDPAKALNESGLQWNIDGGTFEIALVDDAGQHISRHQIDVRAGLPPQGSTVQSIMNSISAIDGLEASVLPSGEVQIETTAPNLQFTFAEDTSGFLAAAGINTFFQGNSAETIAVNSFLRERPEYLAISAGGINNDTDVLNKMVDLTEQGIDRHGGASISTQYREVINRLSETAANQKAVTTGLQQFYATLQSEHLAISGVNIDEEAIKMIGYQRVFQASSRVVAAANEMLEILTSL